MKKIYTLLFVFVLSISILSAQNRYWVNGAGNWNDIQHWSLTSGGEAGVSVPTLNNDVYFDNNSFTQNSNTVNISEVVYARSIINSTNLIINGNGVVITTVSVVRKDIVSSENIIFEEETPTDIHAGVAFDFTVTAQDVSCSGVCDGKLTVNITSGIPTYPVDIRLRYPSDLQPPQYVYFNNLTAADFPYEITGLCGSAQSYNVRLEATDGYKKSHNERVLAPDAIIVEDSNTDDATCNGDCDGKAEILDVSGGTGTIHHSWSNGTTNQDFIDNLCAGNYTDTLTDDNDCQITFDFTVNEPAAIVIDDSTYTEYICAGVGGGSIDVDASGGTGSLTYDDGSTTNNDGDFTGLAAGTYNITITDDAGCTKVSGPYVLHANSSVDVTETHVDVNCKGGSDGSIDVSVSGGTSPYLYDWDNDGTGDNDDSEDLSGLIAGDYNLTVTDNVGCTGTISVTINEPALDLTTSETHVDVNCKGGSDGSIDLSISGGTTPYQIDWDNDGTGDNDDSEDLSGLIAGNYNVTVTDAHGCQSNLSVTINEPDQILLFDNITTVSCNGVCDGSVALMISGGVGPYDFIWSSGETATDVNTHSISSKCAGSYSVTVTDTHGCSETGTYNIAEPDAMSIAFEITQNQCDGEANAQIIAHVTGGSQPYDTPYSWSAGNVLNDSTINNLSAGNYIVTVTDANGCQKIDNTNIVDPVALTLTLDSTHNVMCFNEINGDIYTTILGGTLPITDISWTGPNGYTGNTEDITGLESGDYNVTVTDNNGCTATLGPINISQPLEITGVINNRLANKCNGDCIASVEVVVTNGVAPFTFNWDGNISNIDTVGNLCAGAHTLIISDTNGCSSQLINYNISEPASIQIDAINTTDVTCNNGADGQIQITVSGGTPNYSFDNGTLTNTDGDFQNLTAGDYFITVTDANGCQTISPVITINDGDSLFVNFTNISQAICPSSCIDTATATAGGGSGNYTYVWATGPNAQIAENLCKGYNTITVTDAITGCFVEDSVLVRDSSILLVTVDTIMSPNCYGEFNGEIQITVSNGNIPYGYNWTGPNGYTNNTDEDINNLEAGVYYLTVNDGTGNCDYTAVYTMTQPDSLIAHLTIDNQASCFGTCDGQISVIEEGGTAPYYYIWSNGDNGTVASNLCVGYTAITLTDDHGCSNIDSLEIIQPTQITSSIDILDTLSCYGDCDARIQVVANSGSTPYTYVWSSSANTLDIESNLCAGWVYVTITDNNGCTKQDSIEISEPIELTLTNIVNNQVQCGGDCSGSATVTANGGTGIYTYAWPDGQTVTQVDTLCIGFYTVTVNDAASCSASTTFEIEDVSSLLITRIDSSNISCYGDCNGSFEVDAVNGQTPYSFEWSNGDSDTLAENLCDQLYYVTVTDANNCHDVDSIHLVQPDSLDINFEIFNPTCNADADGEITAHIIGGTTPTYTFVWDGIAVNDSVISNLSSGYYKLTFTDNNGCVKVDSAQVIEPLPIIATIVDSTMNLCFSDCNGSAIVNGSGGTESGSYDYAWNDAVNTTDSNLVGLCNGMYQVTVTDDNGCSDTTSVQITSPDSLHIDFINIVNVACNGGATGTAQADVSGGTNPYTYTWSTANLLNDSTINNVTFGDYFLTVVDANGCSKMASVSIQDTSNLSISVVDSTMISCYGLCDGAYTVSANGGTRPYSFVYYDRWGQSIPTSPDSVITDLCGDLYVVGVTDNNGCSEYKNIIVTTPDSISIAFDSTNVDCFGNNTGEAIAHVTGGTLPYTYSWSPVGGTVYQDSIYQDISAGYYLVSVTDAQGCNKVDSVELIQANDIILSFDNISTLLCYQDTGSARVLVNGGTSPYTYFWANSETDSIADTLLVGWNLVTVTDAHGCNKVDSVEIQAPEQLLLDSLIATPTACGTICSGTANAYVSGGVEDYTYTWSNGDVLVDDSLNTNLCFGNINLTVTDANACSVEGATFITDTSNLAINVVDSTMITCSGSATGSALAVATGGYLPYTIDWSSGQQVIDNDSLYATGLIAGIYYVTVVDDSLCHAVDSVNIIEQDILMVNPIQGNLSCGGVCMGTIDLQTTGGITPYTFVWAEMPDATAYVDSLCDGMYHYTITDAVGCQIVDSVNLIAPSALVLNIDSVQNVLCFGDSTGYAILSIAGGTAPFDVHWSNADNDTIADTLSAGWYYVTVQDAGNCLGIDSVEITQPTELQLSLQSVTNTACGQCIGASSVLPSGGVMPYVLDWGINAGNQSTADAINLCADIYNVSLVDSNHCLVNLPVTVNDTSSLGISVVDSTLISCYNDCDGGLVAVSDSGTVPHTIFWYSISDLANPIGSINNDTLILNGLCADTLKLTVVDADGCRESVLFDLQNPDSLQLSLIVGNMSCFGDSSGSISAVPFGGTPVYDYLWQDASSDSTLSNLTNGTYYITLTDAHGCFVSDSADIVSSPEIFSSILIADTSLCRQDPNSSLELTVWGGVPNYTFLWSNDSTTQNISNLPATTYVVTITDANSCQHADSVTIQPGIVFDFGVGNDTIICSNDTLQLSSYANTPQWNTNFYHWIGSDYISDTLVQNPLVYPNSSMTFYLTVDSICKDTASILVQLYDTIGIYAGPDETILKDQHVQLSASLHDSLISYLWSPSIGLSNDTIYNPDASPKETIIYLLKVKTIYGCYETDSLIVNVIPDLIFPSGITPNDDGINDEWVIDYVFKFPNIEVEIFNRWGEQLFYSKGYPDDQRWDGTYKGNDLPVGTYYYLVKLNDGIHNEPITGPITIVR